MIQAWRDKVAVVTGASRGLGAALALGGARRGARVALLARDRTALESVAERIRTAGGAALVCPVDLTDWDAVDAAFERIATEWGRVDLLFNAAGAKRVGSIERLTRADAQALLDVNYLGALACCQAAIPIMRRVGGGHLFNISSVLGKRATPTRGAYAASKAALNALTDALRVELATSGIRVTLVCPGRFSDAAPGDAAQLAMRSDAAAERILDCVDHPRRELVLTFAGRGLVGLNAWAPGLVDWVLARWRRSASDGHDGQHGRVVLSQEEGR